MKLRLSKEFELKIKQMEKEHSERVHTTKYETRKAFDYTMENMKNIYEDEIKALKAKLKEHEDKISLLKRERVKLEGDI